MFSSFEIYKIALLHFSQSEIYVNPSVQIYDYKTSHANILALI